MHSASSSSKDSQPLRCPRCGSTHIAAILRGMPIMDEQLEKRLAAGEVIIGGCIILGNDPEHFCNACGHEWRTSPPEKCE